MNRFTIISTLAMLVALSVGGVARADEQKDSDVQKERQQTIRRLSLDIAGREPTEQEMRDLAGDGSADAYRKAVERFYSELRDKRVRLDLDKQARDVADAERALVLTYVAAKDVQGPTTYMGVGVETPGDTLRAQLKLPNGVGLVVNYIDPNGPSKELIHLHDVLEKLDDQLLINGEQFATLVRMRKQGDSINVGVIREAKHINVTVHLGEKETSSANTTDIDLTKVDTRVANINGVGNINTADLVVGLVPMTTGVSDNLFSAARTGPVTFDDGSTVAVLQRAGDQNVLSAFDRASGKVVFSGPVNNDQQWNSVPEDLRKKLATWRGLGGMQLNYNLSTGLTTSLTTSDTGIFTNVPYINQLYQFRTELPTTQPAKK